MYLHAHLTYVWGYPHSGRHQHEEGKEAHKACLDQGILRRGYSSEGNGAQLQPVCS
jgi:hypothetical protein